MRRFFLSVYFRLQSARPRGGTTHLPCLFCSIVTISIHTPRMGARRYHQRHKQHRHNFNPHAPHGGATNARCARAQRPRNFNPRAPCGGATCVVKLFPRHLAISIHAPRVGARRRRRSCRTSRYLFQSTRPRRVRRTNGFANIHHILFQSTRPRRARLARASPFTSTASFQSTRPRRARPGKTTFLNAILAISIHAPA